MLSSSSLDTARIRRRFESHTEHFFNWCFSIVTIKSITFKILAKMMNVKVLKANVRTNALVFKPTTRFQRNVGVIPKSSETEVQETSAPSTPENATVFYAGKAMTEQEFSSITSNNTISSPSAASVQPDSDPAPSISDLMAFTGGVPEIVNFRLAMFGFVAALGSELVSGESVVNQFKDEPTGVLLAVILFTSASFIPFLYGANKKQSFGPFTPQAEIMNGRAACIGFLSLLIAEGVRGGAALF